MHSRTSQAHRPPASLIFPTYNPGPLLEQTWGRVRDFLDGPGQDWEILFVCDGCHDGTPERLAELTRAAPGRVRILSHTPNRGKGYAVRRGLEAATGPRRIFTDVDLAYPFEDILTLERALREGSDVAVASRVHPDSRVLLPVRLQGYAQRRYRQSRAFARLARWLLPLQAHDPQAGLKGLTARAAELLLPRLRCRGFGFDCELLTACARFGLSLTEVPVCVRYETAASTTGPGSAARMLYELWKIRRRWGRAGLPPARVPASAPPLGVAA